MLENQLKEIVSTAIDALYQVQSLTLSLEKTPKQFSGDYTIVLFPLVKFSKQSPEKTAETVGNKMMQLCPMIESFSVVKGFLNLTMTTESIFTAFKEQSLAPFVEKKQKYLVEFSSPNTNKPLHLGHIRNNLLGDSMCRILKACGHEVQAIQIINDRGIHICKSMVAWKRYGHDQTPEEAHMKGDHFVGKFYVEFEKKHRLEVESLQAQGLSKEEAEKKSSLNQEAQTMLREWEHGDANTVALWKKMNNWVYEGFEATYKKLGVAFDKNYYESQTYILGKEIIREGLKKGIFKQKEDGSVWVDLTNDGLDEKILLRSDGTSVYITQDIGTAIERHRDFNFDNMIYTVADEQDYHFKVLFLVLEKLGYTWASRCHHLSYGMVTLPSGRMKSREGTVVDADDLIDQMEKTAGELAKERGKNASQENNAMIGMAALKYQLLKVDPKKSVLFDPEESIDFHGKTGPFIQYTYARIQSLLKKHGQSEKPVHLPSTLLEIERNILKKCLDYQQQLMAAAQQQNPALLANYLYELVKTYNTYYQDTPILQAEFAQETKFRMALSTRVATIVETTSKLLGFDVPREM